MTLEEFLKLNPNPDEVADWAVKNLQYFEGAGLEERMGKQLETDPDLAKTWACDLIGGKSAVCSNFAALPVVAAKKRGAPSGMVYAKKKDSKYGHTWGWWMRPDGSIRTVSVPEKGKSEIGSYESFDELYKTFSESRYSEGNKVYFQDATGNFMISPKEETEYFNLATQQIRSFLGDMPKKKGGTVTEAEDERFKSTIFKNL